MTGTRVEERPHWERGYRVHGYWLGTERVGWVSLGPRAVTRAARDGYGWGVVLPKGKTLEGRAASLRQAKRKVENLYMAEGEITLRHDVRELRL
jgi:hypothetical protein